MLWPAWSFLDNFGDLTDIFSPHTHRKALADVVMTTGMSGGVHPGPVGGFQGAKPLRVLGALPVRTELSTDGPCER